MSLHNPVTTIPLKNGSVEIRELSWPDALHLYNTLANKAKTLINDKGDLVMAANALIPMIQESIELSTWLAKAATGKDDEWLNERSVSEVLDVVTAAAELNIGVIAERIKNGRSRLAKLLGGAKTETPAPTAPSPTKSSF